MLRLQNWFLFVMISGGLMLAACGQKAPGTTHVSKINSKLRNISFAGNQFKSIHVFVALCDNKYQGIVPVPAKVGDGQDAATNLYWGNIYGVKAFFKKSADWKLISDRKLNGVLLERVVFKNIEKNYFLVADGYDGRYIKQAITDFLNSCAGRLKDTIGVGGKVIGIDGNSSLVAYVGHDGLMDFQLLEPFQNADGKIRDCIVLACESKQYFGTYLSEAGAKPILYTTTLMCPEAYTLHDAVAAYVSNDTTQIRPAAVKAYNKYQKCGLTLAEKILVSGASGN